MSAARAERLPAPFPVLQRLDTAPVHEQVYQQLRAALMAGAFRPGQPVTLGGAAQALGVSLMPVREAVRRLVTEGVLEMPTARSIRVPPVSLERFDELCRTRIMLEGEAAALAARYAKPEDLAALAALHAAVGAAAVTGDLAKVLPANQAFHFGVYRLAGNALLLSLIESLWLRGGPYLSLLAGAVRDEALDFVSHDRLLAAIRARAPSEARRAIRADIAVAYKLYRPAIARQADM